MAHSCWSHSAVSRRYMQIINSNQSGNHRNQYPDCNHWKYCSVLRSSAFSEGDADNYWSVTRCHQDVLHCVYESNSLTQGLRVHLLKMITSKEDRALLRIMRRTDFLSSSKIKVEVIRRTGLPVFVRNCLRTIAAAVTCWHTSRRTGIISTSLMCLLMSPWAASTTVMDVPEFF